MKYRIGEFDFVILDENNKDDLIFEETLLNENAEDRFVKQIHERLHLRQRDLSQLACMQAYLVKKDDQYLGYVFIGGQEFDKLYLEYMITKKQRGHAYAFKILQALVPYLFDNYNLESILLDIDQDNMASIKTASKAGFYYDEDEYQCGNRRLSFELNNPYYVSKRRKG